MSQQASLSEREKRGIFALLWAMARADGHVVEGEQALLERLHQRFFSKPLRTWSQPEEFDPSQVAGDLARPEAKRVAFELLFEVVHADDLELDTEIAFLAQCARRIGLADAGSQAAWESVAKGIFERAVHDLTARRFASLGRELARLRNDLLLGPEVARAATRAIRAQLESFEVE